MEKNDDIESSYHLKLIYLILRIFYFDEFLFLILYLIISFIKNNY